MKRTFSLFLALLIVFQSIIAVGEEQIPALKSKKENQSFTGYRTKRVDENRSTAR